VKPDPKPGCGAQAILDGWSLSEKGFRRWSPEPENLGPGSSELYK